MQDSGTRSFQLRFLILDTGYLILDTGYWVLDTPYLILDSGFRILFTVHRSPFTFLLLSLNPEPETLNSKRYSSFFRNESTISASFAASTCSFL